MKLSLKSMSFSAKACFLGGAVNLVALVAFCIYGAVYEYFDYIVCLSLILGVLCSVGYTLIDNFAAEYLNPVAIFCESSGLGLFFLNSYPVWADRLNDITMYGSRGTLVPVIAIMVLCIVSIALYIVSCFGGKEMSR